MISLVFSVQGRVAGQGSKNKGRNGSYYEASAYLEPWREKVRGAAMIALLGNDRFDQEAEALQVEITFAHERPAKHFTSAGELRDDAPLYYPQTPDIDKCARAVLDSLTAAKVIVDDRRVVRLRLAQLYAPGHTGGGATVVVTPVPVRGWAGV